MFGCTSQRNVYGVPSVSAGTWYVVFCGPVTMVALEHVGAARVLDRDVVRDALVLIVELDDEGLSGRRLDLLRVERDVQRRDMDEWSRPTAQFRRTQRAPAGDGAPDAAALQPGPRCHSAPREPV